MMTKGHLQNMGLTIVTALVFLAGCRSSTPPVEFYTLSPLTSVSEADKVAGLRDNIAVTMNLATLLPSSLVAAFPWEDYFDPDYRVYMEVQQFDGRLGQYAQLVITWTITTQEARKILLVRKSLIREPVQGEDYAAFVAAKSRILATLSRQIAQGIKEADGGKYSAVRYSAVRYSAVRFSILWDFGRWKRDTLSPQPSVLITIFFSLPNP